MPVEELSCRELVEIVTDYLEGALSPADYKRFERHLGVCEGCTIYVDQMRETIRLTGMLREDQIPDDAREALLQAFRGWKSSS
jgi:predicted anti-sigma-YlaC factor YlaD